MRFTKCFVMENNQEEAFQIVRSGTNIYAVTGKSRRIQECFTSFISFLGLPLSRDPETRPSR